MSETVKIKRLHPDAVLPKKAHEGDAGFDLVAVEDVIIEPGETALVPTGIAVELPEGFELQVRPRSGITLKTKLRVQLGTVDSNYRGEIGVIVDNISPIHLELEEEEDGEYLINVEHERGYLLTDGRFGKDFARTYRRGTYLIRKGDRIAQAIIQRLPSVEFVEVEELGESGRGEGGFGSSGVRDTEDFSEGVDDLLNNYGDTLEGLAKKEAE